MALIAIYENIRVLDDLHSEILAFGEINVGQLILWVGMEPDFLLVEENIFHNDDILLAASEFFSFVLFLEILDYAVIVPHEIPSWVVEF